MWIIIGGCAAIIIIGWMVSLQLELNRLERSRRAVTDDVIELRTIGRQEIEAMIRKLAADVSLDVRELMDSMNRVADSGRNTGRLAMECSGRISETFATVDLQTRQMNALTERVDELTARVGAPPAERGDGEQPDIVPMEMRLAVIEEAIRHTLTQSAKMTDEERQAIDDMQRKIDKWVSEITSRLEHIVAFSDQANAEQERAIQQQIEALDVEVDGIIDTLNDHDQALRLISVQGVAPATRKERRIERKTKASKAT